MQRSTPVRLLFLLGAFLCALGAGRLVPHLARQRNTHRLTARPAQEGVPPEYILTSAILGGFRGLFITHLWGRAQNMKNEGKFYEMIDIYNIITKLQPNYHASWAFIAWDLAYNVSVEQQNDYNDRVFWVFRGIDMLRRQGIPKNPNVAGLYQELAWILYHKVGGELDYAFPYYRARLANETWSIFRGQLSGEQQTNALITVSLLPPDRTAFLALPTSRAAQAALQQAGFDLLADAETLLGADAPAEAAALLADPDVAKGVRDAAFWNLGARLRTRLGMNPNAMAAIARRYGPIDWSTPYAQALYWSLLARKVYITGNPKNFAGHITGGLLNEAERGEAYKEKLTLKYERIPYFCLIKLCHQGETVYLEAEEKGGVIGVPDYRFLWGVIRHMEDLLAFYKEEAQKRGETVNLTGTRSGYHNFLRAAVLNAWMDGKKKIAARVHQKLIQAKGDPSDNVPLQEYVNKEMREFLDSMKTERALWLIHSYLTRAYLYMGMGDRSGYERQLDWAKSFHHYCLRRWNPGETETKGPARIHEYRVPSWTNLRKGAVLSLLLEGQNQYPAQLLNSIAARLQSVDPVLWDAVRAELESIRQQRQQMPAPVAP